MIGSIVYAKSVKYRITKAANAMFSLFTRRANTCLKLIRRTSISCVVCHSFSDSEEGDRD